MPPLVPGGKGCRLNNTDGEMRVQRDFVPSKGHRAHPGKHCSGSLQCEAEFLPLGSPGPRPHYHH